MQVTRTLAKFLVTHKPTAVPQAVRHEGARALLNWAGCAVGASQHETIHRALAALNEFSGPREATILGRRERVDIFQAALLNGASSHTFDFDDTHIKTVIHPSAPVLPAILALAEHKAVSGRDFLHAFLLGVETECRIGASIMPNHYDAGWHITATAGVFGATAAAGRLLKLNEQQMVRGAGHRRHACLRCARNLWQHGETASPRHRRTQWPDSGVDGEKKRRRAGAGYRWPTRFRAGGFHQIRCGSDHRRLGQNLGDCGKQLQALRLRRGDPPGHRRLRATAQRT